MKKTIISIGVWSLPALAFAQANAYSILSTIRGILNVVIPILITLGIIYFIWGVIEYVISKTEEAKKEGRDKMIYGIIGLFVIISIWGLVGILSNTFGIQAGGSLTPSQIPGVLP